MLMFFLFTIVSLHVVLIIQGCMSMFKVGKGSPGVLNSIPQKFQFEILWIGMVHSGYTDPTQATAYYCSCMQVTKEQYWGQQFCQVERDISVRPTKMTRPVKVDHLQSSVLNIPVRPNWNGPFHLMNQPKFLEFWVERKAPKDSSLSRILRFTPRLHTAYLRNGFQLFLLNVCHTVDQFNIMKKPENQWTQKSLWSLNPANCVISSLFTIFKIYCLNFSLLFS